MTGTAAQWRRGPGGVRVLVGGFPEPGEQELTPYRYAAVPVDERPYPSCGRPGSGRAAHRRAGEPPCEICRRAEAEYSAERRAIREAAQLGLDLVEAS